MNEATKPTEEAGEVADFIKRCKLNAVKAAADNVPEVSQFLRKAAALLTRLQIEKEELEYKVAHREAMFKQREELIRDLQKLASSAGRDSATPDSQERRKGERRTLKLDIDGEMKSQGRKYRSGTDRRK